MLKRLKSMKFIIFESVPINQLQQNRHFFKFCFSEVLQISLLLNNCVIAFAKKYHLYSTEKKAV